jgi:hypothetical protein
LLTFLALELYLKAYLLGNGANLQYVSGRIGHSIQRAMKEAQKGSSGIFWCFLIGVFRAFRMEAVFKPSQRAADWCGQRAHRFAPVLAPLRCARPVEALERFVGKVAPKEGTLAKIRP